MRSPGFRGTSCSRNVLKVSGITTAFAIPVSSSSDTNTIPFALPGLCLTMTELATLHTKGRVSVAGDSDEEHVNQRRSCSSWFYRSMKLKS